MKSWHRPLLICAGLMCALMFVCLAGSLIDDRTLLGESVWVKPLKFGFAFGLYAGTLAWLLSKLTRGRRVGWWVGCVFAAPRPSRSASSPCRRPVAPSVTSTPTRAIPSPWPWSRSSPTA
ncbi:hypothetical protein ACFQX6_42975 [Streptosporangium lutulentum]